MKPKPAHFFVAFCFSMFTVFNVVSAGTLYDSNGFESFSLGSLPGQDGWTGSGGGGGVVPLVVTTPPDPVIGTKAVRLEIPDLQGAASVMEHAIPATPLNGQTITVSFDIYRQDGPWLSNLWWWWWDAGEPTYGLQWDHYGEYSETLPNGWNPGAGSALTVLDRYANIKMVWDFTTDKAYSWYDGVLVDNGIPITNITALTGWTIQLSHDEATGSGPELAWIDNFVITSTVVAPVPEPTTMLLLGSGLISLWGARRKFRK